MSLLINLVLSIFVACSYAGQDDLIIKKLSNDVGFEFKFEQNNFYKFLKQPKKSSGTALFNCPSNFIWELGGDNAVKIVSNGKKTWIYSPAEEEGDIPTMTVRDGQLSDGIQSLILGAKYKMSDIKDSKLFVKGSKDKGYKWASIRFTDTGDFKLDSIEFEDIDGSKVLIDIRDFKRLDKKKPASTFIFKAPKGTRIIR